MLLPMRLAANSCKNINDGKVQMICMEKYDVMNYMAFSMLYTWHNDAIRPAGLDPWKSNWMPNKIDLVCLKSQLTNAQEVITAMEAAENK